MQRRHRQTIPLEERLAQHASRLGETAESLPQGSAREELLRKARQADESLHLCERLMSPGLQLQK